MGALSSWGMLAFTHHLIVQYSAFLTKDVKSPFVWFTEYMILGDDIVIYNKRVADSYLEQMTLLDVGISPTKTLTSRKGVFEFAKRLSTPQGPGQGLPLAELAAARFNLSVLLEAFQKSSLRPSLGTFMKFHGFGYRVLGSMGKFGDLSRRSHLVQLTGLLPGVTIQSFPNLSK